MDKNHLDDDFAEIAESFQNYKNAISSDNNDSAIEGLKDKIVVQFWKTIQKAVISDEMKKMSDKIVEKTVYCLRKYSDKNPEEFCKLTYTSIMNSLKAQADLDDFENRSGMHISDNENRLRKQIEKLHKQYLMFKPDDKNAFIEYAVTYCGLKKEDVEEYLTPKRSIPLYAKNKDDSEEYCIADNMVDISHPENNIEATESLEKVKEQLDVINDAWLKQKIDSRQVISELMTLELLEDFSKNNVSEEAIEILKQTQFISKEMVNEFFTNPDYKLPSQQEIGEKYNLTKSAVSVKLKRFIASIKK